MIIVDQIKEVRNHLKASVDPEAYSAIKVIILVFVLFVGADQFWRLPIKMTQFVTPAIIFIGVVVTQKILYKNNQKGRLQDLILQEKNQVSIELSESMEVIGSSLAMMKAWVEHFHLRGLGGGDEYRNFASENIKLYGQDKPFMRMRSKKSIYYPYSKTSNFLGRVFGLYIESLSKMQRSLLAGEELEKDSLRLLEGWNEFELIMDEFCELLNEQTYSELIGIKIKDYEINPVKEYQYFKQVDGVDSRLITEKFKMWGLREEYSERLKLILAKKGKDVFEVE